MADTSKQGQVEAHTPTAAGADAPSSAMPGADPADLLAGSPDLGEGDVLQAVAELSAAARRGRGRPLGAANRKGNDMVKYLASLGHRDPMVTLSMIQTADFAALCKMVGASKAKDKIAVLKMQQSAADGLMPYHHARKPQQIELPVGDKRPFMAIGEMNVGVVIANGGFMTAGELPTETQGNQGVIDGEAVRGESRSSHK